MRLLIAIQNYNGERWLRECIASAMAVKACSYNDDVQIVLLDAGSTDKSREIAEHFVGILLTPHPRLSQSQAMNLAAGTLAFDWFSFVNNDDMLLPCYFEAHKRTMAAHPDAVLLHSYCAFYQEAQRTGDYRAIADTWEQNMRRGLNYITQPTICISRQCFETYGLFDESVKYCYDFEYTSRVWSRGGTIAVTPEVTAFYRLRADNLSAVRQAEITPEWREIGRRNCGVK